MDPTWGMSSIWGNPNNARMVAPYVDRLRSIWHMFRDPLFDEEANAYANQIESAAPMDVPLILPDPRGIPDFGPPLPGEEMEIDLGTFDPNLAKGQAMRQLGGMSDPASIAGLLTLPVAAGPGIATKLPMLAKVAQAVDLGAGAIDLGAGIQDINEAETEGEVWGGIARALLGGAMSVPGANSAFKGEKAALSNATSELEEIADLIPESPKTMVPQSGRSMVPEEVADLQVPDFNASELPAMEDLPVPEGLRPEDFVPFEPDPAIPQRLRIAQEVQPDLPEFDLSITPQERMDLPAFEDTKIPELENEGLPDIGNRTVKPDVNPKPEKPWEIPVGDDEIDAVHVMQRDLGKIPEEPLNLKSRKRLRASAQNALESEGTQIDIPQEKPEFTGPEGEVKVKVGEDEEIPIKLKEEEPLPSDVLQEEKLKPGQGNQRAYYLTHPLREYISKHSPELSKLLVSARDDAAAAAGKFKASYREAIHGLSRQEKDTVMDWLDGKIVKIDDPKLADAGYKLRTMLDQVLQEARDANLDVGEVKRYFPHLIKNENKFSELYLGPESQKSTHLDFSREVDADAPFVRNLDVLEHYADEAYRRIHQHQKFGGNLERLTNLEARFPKLYAGSVRKAIYRAIGRDTDTAGAKILRQLRKGMSFVSLPTSAPLQFTQAANIAGVAGLRNTIRATKIFPDLVKIGKIDAIRSAAITGTRSMEDLYGVTASPLTRRVWDNMSLWGVSAADSVMRSWANEAGILLSKEAVNGNKAAIRRIKLIDPNIEIPTKWTQDFGDTIGRATSNKSQFLVDPLEMPGWSTGPAAKLATQFLSFPYQTTRLVANQLSDIAKYTKAGDMKMAGTAAANFVKMGLLGGLVTAEIAQLGQEGLKAGIRGAYAGSVEAAIDKFNESYDQGTPEDKAELVQKILAGKRIGTNPTEIIEFLQKAESGEVTEKELKKFMTGLNARFWANTARQGYFGILGTMVEDATHTKDKADLAEIAVGPAGQKALRVAEPFLKEEELGDAFKKAGREILPASWLLPDMEDPGRKRKKRTKLKRRKRRQR